MTLGEYLKLFVAPITAAASFLRIDQGVDYNSPTNVRAIGSGVIYKVSPPGSWAGGTGQAVYERLDTPIIINARRYTEVYYAEQRPLVSVGQRVKAGQDVMAPGGNELGFAQNGSPIAALIGGLGAGTQPTLPGKDFNDFVHMLLSHSTTTQAPATTGPFPGSVDTKTHAAGSAVAGAASGAAGAVGSAANSVASATESVGKFLGKLGDPGFWLRVLEILGGAVLVLYGLVLLARQVGLADSSSGGRGGPTVVPVPV